MDGEIAKVEYIIREINEMEADEDRPAKRKRVVLSLEDKMNVIMEKEKGKQKSCNFAKKSLNF